MLRETKFRIAAGALAFATGFSIGLSGVGTQPDLDISNVHPVLLEQTTFEGCRSTGWSVTYYGEFYQRATVEIDVDTSTVYLTPLSRETQEIVYCDGFE